MPSNTSINVKNGTIGICGGFYNESNLVSVTFPNTLEYIDNRAFSYCRKKRNLQNYVTVQERRWEEYK